MLQPTVRIEDLTTGYLERGTPLVVTDHLSEALENGELTCLLGPNGSGKSTLLKTLSAFLPPLEGKIFICGRELVDYKDNELAKLIGVVLTERLSMTEMTVWELIAKGRSPYTGFLGSLSAKDKEIVEEAILLVGIESLKNRKVATLSDGERQKVMIAKTLAQQTPVIFLDEPTAFLDYPGKVEIMLLLKDLARQHGKTIFISTHDLEIALQIADKAWLIDKQKGVKTGDIKSLASEGLIGRYFDSERLTFDVDSLRFRIIEK